ncbi:MAG: hypothetical protein A3I38_00720 [Candidatus Wildermuthbacteria bacterium RIFCSPLOWO2_02_FULL_47_10]|uniref:Transposase IS200-like domain-containing protein n=1 Tax=Candidatus Wildermuthbacteria bacterium RIFCSPHIGHO2_02_FULL_47_17 TaxID=1802452 RepID=A0A1G2R259_9BACT|nr:MAG: hypothetical protein A3D59_01680 [Candidatus Wildermuthbacteria bacterium RIFCSPHIGHO2_02_FULL_47_17]OHA74757.1 MAG: hypothetical protein A3I38_00720 [Candidatus Wildermuthbacteria bacterium RIFCSPLOWO2_02_FULL_47_10]
MRNIRFIAGQIYHVYNRGVEKRNIFMADSDRWRFLQGMLLFNNVHSVARLLWEVERSQGAATFRTIKEYIKKQPANREPLVNIVADCLMDNHYHLIIEQIKEDGVSKFMHKLGTGYTLYINKKYNRSGALFQGTYKAAHVESELYLKNLLVYVNLINPSQLVEPRLKETGPQDINVLMEFAETYPWSTHLEYLQKRESIIVDKGILGKLFADPLEYKDFARGVLLGRKYEILGRLALE